jgi:hypothetical protein
MSYPQSFLLVKVVYLGQPDQEVCCLRSISFDEPWHLEGNHPQLLAAAVFDHLPDILKLLSLLSRYFISSSLSVKYTRSGDAIRILAISCMAVICDAALRKMQWASPRSCRCIIFITL